MMQDGILNACLRKADYARRAGNMKRAEYWMAKYFAFLQKGE